MIHATLPAIVAIVGALVYALSANPKIARLGEIAFAAGLLVAVYVVAHEGVTIP